MAFTDPVNDVQARCGSRRFYAGRAVRAGAAEGPDPLTPDVQGYLAERDGFHLATVGTTGGPP